MINLHLEKLLMIICDPVSFKKVKQLQRILFTVASQMNNVSWYITILISNSTYVGFQ